MRRALANVFFCVGILSTILFGYLLWKRYAPNQLSFSSVILPGELRTNTISPTSLEIEDLSLALPVFSQSLTGTRWPLSDKGVVYLTNTPAPGEKGNSVLYGHDWPNILGRLVKIKPGAIVSIGFADGTRRRFIVQYTQVVTPDQTHILAPTEDTRLTLYTCTGFFDQKRFVVTAVPVDSLSSR